MFVPTKKFKSLPFLANSVQQFSMWVQSAHGILGKELAGPKLSFTFNTNHALSLCQVLNSQFDLIYTSNLMDHLGPPNLILSAIKLLKDNGLLFSSTLLYKNFTSNLDEFIATCFGFDCKLFSFILGIRCINHEGTGYSSPVMSEPIPVHAGDKLKIAQHCKKLTFQKVSAHSLVIPKLPQFKDGNITCTIFDSVKTSVFSLLNSSGGGIDILNSRCVETAVLILQTFASSLHADVGDYHFWDSLSSVLHELKPYLHSFQAQLLLHKFHMHLVVTEANCPLCNNSPMEEYLGTFCAEVPLPIEYLSPRFIAFIHQHSSSDVLCLCKEAASGREVHIFDCFDGTVQNQTLKLKFFAPQKFVQNNYNVTIGFSYIKSHDNMPDSNLFMMCIPTISLQSKQIKFTHYAFSPTTSLNSSSDANDLGKLTFHGGDGDKMQTEIALSDAVRTSTQYKLSTSKVSSDAIKLIFGKLSFLLIFKYPVNYSGINIQLSKAQGIVYITSPRQPYDFTKEKTMSITAPDHQLSLPQQHVKYEIMTCHSGMQMSEKDWKIINACGRDHKFMPPLLNVKESLMIFFQRHEETYFSIAISPKNIKCGYIIVNKALFDYQHRAPAIDLAFYFANSSCIQAIHSSMNIVLPIREINVDEAELKVLQKTFTYFASRTNGTCRSACKPNKFEQLQKHMVDHHFTRAVVYLLYGDADQSIKDVISRFEGFHASNVGKQSTIQCEYCDKFCPEAKKCGRCKTVQYCSKDCQTKHWPVHRKNCKVVALQSKAAEEPIKDNGAKTSRAAMKPADDQMKVRCSHCNSRSDNLKKCKRCGVAQYCDTECQRNHWPKHKCECKAALKAKSLASKAGSSSVESQYSSSATANGPTLSQQGGQGLDSCTYCGSCSTKLKSCAKCGNTKYCGKE